MATATTTTVAAALPKSNAVILEKKPVSYQTLLLGAGNSLNLLSL
jgi:hypothetical protein